MLSFPSAVKIYLCNEPADMPRSFDFQSVPQVNKKQIIDLSMCGFIDKRNNIVFTGPPGVGKTHLAIAIGTEACRRGYNVKFFTSAALVNTYIEARQEKSILRLEGHIKSVTSLSSMNLAMCHLTG